MREAAVAPQIAPHRAQVFAEGGIRTAESQHSWLKQHATPIVMDATSRPAWEWNAERRELVVHEPTRISGPDIMDIAKLAMGQKRK